MKDALLIHFLARSCNLVAWKRVYCTSARLFNDMVDDCQHAVKIQFREKHIFGYRLVSGRRIKEDF